VDVFGDTGYNFDSRCTFKLYVLFYRLSHFCALTQCCIAKNGGGYTQRGVANGLKVPCLFMITEVSIRCQKNPEVGIRRIPVYTPQYTTALTRPVGRGVRWVRAHTPQISTKCKIKNTDTVHNAPCIEERSTFLQRHSHFPLFFTTTPPIFHFFTKNTPPFHFVPTGLLMLVS